MQGMIGKVIKEYEILELLGRGGMGSVYRAHDRLLDRDVAVKTMDVLMASDPNFLRRFQSEARALAKLNDPNIVSVFNLLETPEGICIVMEYVRGRTLSDILKETPRLPVGRAVRLFRQIFTALDHAHGEGVIHRDIKPGNVMVTGADVVKVTDFGLAKIQTAGGTTVTKGTAGTLYYMSPEQIRGLGQVDARGDIYSAGMALYECVAGGLPFSPDSSEYTIANMIVEGLIPPPGNINASIPPGLSHIVMKAIEKDPARRYQNAGEVLTALGSLTEAGVTPDLTHADDATVVSTTTAGAALSSARTGRHGRRVYRALIGAALLLGIVYFVLRLSVFPPAGKLSVLTDPPGAGVIIDQAAAKPSPVTDLTLGPGRHVLLAQWDDASIDTSVTIVSGQPSLVVIAKPAGLPAPSHGSDAEAGPAAAGEARLVLIAVPDGEAAVDDGTFRPARSGLSLGVGAGTRKVLFRDGKGNLREKSVNLRAGEANTVRCFFQGIVHVEATLDHISSPAAILVDGIPARVKTPARIAVPPGTHRIAVRMENYVSVPEEETVTIEPSFDTPRPYAVTFRMRREQ